MSDLMSDFDWSEETHKCTTCENAKYKGHTKTGDVYFCNKKRSYITETTESWLCRNEHYERKGKK